jgi:hypothetical protein
MLGYCMVGTKYKEGDILTSEAFEDKIVLLQVTNITTDFNGYYSYYYMKLISSLNQGEVEKYNISFIDNHKEIRLATPLERILYASS